MAQVFNSQLRTGAAMIPPTGSCAVGALPAVGGTAHIVGAPAVAAVGACGSTGFARGVTTTTGAHNPMLTSTLRTSGVPTMGPIISSKISDTMVGAVPSQHNITGSVIGGSLGGAHIHTSGIGAPGGFGSGAGFGSAGVGGLGGAGFGGVGHTHTTGVATGVGLGPGVGGAVSLGGMGGAVGLGGMGGAVGLGGAPHAHVTTGPVGGIGGGVGVGVAGTPHTHITTTTTTTPVVGGGAIGGVVDAGVAVPHTHLTTTAAAPVGFAGGVTTPGYINNVGYYPTTGNFCSRRCGGLPWWLWILLGLLLAGLIGGLSWFLKRSSGKGGRSSSTEEDSSSSSSSSSSSKNGGKST